MSKKEISTKGSENNVAKEFSFEGKSNDELEEIAKTLQAQLQQYQTMAVKAQGALEVILQMLPEEDKSEG